MKSRLLLLLALVLGVAFAQEPVFRVGVVTALSGDNAQGGEWTRRGYDLWANKVNEQGGIKIGDKSYKVELIYYDDQSSSASAAAACERMLTEQQIDFILGPYASSATRACGPIVDKYKVPMITGSAENPLIWTDGYDYVFGTIPSVNLIGTAPIRLVAAADPKPATMYIVALDDPFAIATGETFAAVAGELGIRVLGQDIVPADADFTPVFTKVRQANPDILAIGTQPDQMIAMAKVIKQLRISPKAIIGHTGPGAADFVEALGKDAEYFMGATVWQAQFEYEGPKTGPWQSSAEWISDYSRAYHLDYAEYTEAGCSAAGIAFQAALEAAQLTPPLNAAKREALVRALEDLDILTFYGPINFDTTGANRHNISKLETLPLQVLNGKAVVVGPSSPTGSELVYPFPAWGAR